MQDLEKTKFCKNDLYFVEFHMKGIIKGVLGVRHISHADVASLLYYRKMCRQDYYRFMLGPTTFHWASKGLNYGSRFLAIQPIEVTMCSPSLSFM